MAYIEEKQQFDLKNVSKGWKKELSFLEPFKLLRAHFFPVAVLSALPSDAPDLPKICFLITNVYAVFCNKEETFSPFSVHHCYSTSQRGFYEGLCVCVCLRTTRSPFGLCFRPGMGPIKLFLIKLVSELGVCVLAYSP